MSTESNTPTTAAGQAIDELRLQAWLARAEWRNPSLRDDVVGLAQARDQLRVQAHLASLELKGEWDRLEQTWTRVKSTVEQTGGDVRDDLGVLLADLKQGYERLRR